MLRAELRVMEGKHEGKSIPLTVKQFLVGREADCHLRPNSDLVSRHHCVFLVDDYTVRVRDLGSTNGTYVNNERIQGQVVLKAGDRVQIGKLALQLVVRQPVPAAVPVGAPDSDAPEAVDLADSGEHAAAADTASVLETQEIPSASQTIVFDGATALLPPQAQPVPRRGKTPVDIPKVILPDPETTGAKEVNIGSGGAPVPADPAAKDKPAAVNPSSAAADIIKSRMARRPGKPGG